MYLRKAIIDNLNKFDAVLQYIDITNHSFDYTFFFIKIYAGELV